MVIFPSELTSFDKKENHKKEVIERALSITEPEFGPYKFETFDISLVRGRALRVMQKGDLFNLVISLASKDWDEAAIPIKIPLRMGANSYRLLLIHQDYLFRFNKIKTLEDFKSLSLGLDSDWTITRVFKDLNFNVIDATSYNSALSMLEDRRFDYIPRGVNEVFYEVNQSEDLKNIIVEPTLALKIDLATFAYVSPKHPRIAKRLEIGLTKMSTNGELEKIFNKYFLEDIKRANLKSRRIIEIENPLFTHKALLKNKSLWLSPEKIMH